MTAGAAIVSREGSDIQQEAPTMIPIKGIAKNALAMAVLATALPISVICLTLATISRSMTTAMKMLNDESEAPKIGGTINVTFGLNVSPTKALTGEAG